MVERNELVSATLAELDRFGLKGEVGERGKHLEVSWTYPDGRSHFVIVARTASDYRAVLNARGEVRRQLRVAGITPPENKVIVLQKAFTLPKPTDYAAERLVQLEKDVEVLVDLVTELQGQLVEQQNRLNNIRVATTISFDAPQALATPVITQQPKRQGGRSTAVLEALKDGRWYNRNDLAATLGVDVKNVSSLLDVLKNKGLVENGMAGMWRKKPQPLEMVLAV